MPTNPQANPPLGRTLSLDGEPPDAMRHFVKATVRVHEYPDGQVAIYWGPHRLADYAADGSMIAPAAGTLPDMASRDVA